MKERHGGSKLGVLIRQFWAIEFGLHGWPVLG